MDVRSREDSNNQRGQTGLKRPWSSDGHSPGQQSTMRGGTPRGSVELQRPFAVMSWDKRESISGLSSYNWEQASSDWRFARGNLLPPVETISRDAANHIFEPRDATFEDDISESASYGHEPPTKRLRRMEARNNFDDVVKQDNPFGHEAIRAGHLYENNAQTQIDYSERSGDRPPQRLRPTGSSPVSNCRRCSALEPLMQDAAKALTKLVASLRSGLSMSGHEEQDKYPQVSEVGLAPTLQWMVTLLEGTHLFVKQAPEAHMSLVEDDRRTTKNYYDVNMKRRLPPSNDDGSKRHYSDASNPDVRRSSVVSSTPGDELPPIVSRSPYQAGGMGSGDYPPRRPSTMDPPPMRGRQLPSPPNRAQVSPTYALGSPTATYGHGQQAAQQPYVPPLTTSTGSSIGSILQPISPAPSSAEAASAHAQHSAALQHEVSVRTLQLTTLQNEHNELLAALARSQNRARELEKKHAAADAELAGLGEERAQLQAKIVELEQNVDELGRARNEARRAAVAEGAQYVKIVRMASQLEEMATRERRSWEATRAEMEGKVRALEEEAAGGRNPNVGGGSGGGGEGAGFDVEMGEGGTAPEGQAADQTSPGGVGDDSTLVRDLRIEVQRLRRRCSEFESVLSSVRAESRAMAESAQGIDRARRRISDHVDGFFVPGIIRPGEALESRRDEGDEEG